MATMPEGSGSLIARALVDELRRRRLSLTLTQIAGEYGESERNFRRYLKGGAMPLGKGRRFTARVRELHFQVLARLRAAAVGHPRQQEAELALAEADSAFSAGYHSLVSVLETAAKALNQARLSAKAARGQLRDHSLQLRREAVRSVGDHAPFRPEYFAAMIEIGLARAH